MAIDLLLDESTRLWRGCGVTFTPPGRRYTDQEQAANAIELEEARQTVRHEAPAPDAPDAERERSHRRIAAAFVRFARSGLSLEDSHAALLLEGGFAGIAPALEKQARLFDPAVTAAEILQACRNAWTACGLQCLFGQPMGLTPAIFAYSMLYPYSDNFMDKASLDRAAKLRFSRRFGRRLSGEPVAPGDANEETVWRLVALIESQYSRVDRPRVFHSLLDIHLAQEESLRLLDACPQPLPLVFAKGGASVLADGFLAAGDLNAAQASFAFAWGVLLQLGDDLQDVAEDRAARCVTLFTEAAARGTLDELTNRTLHFARAVMALMDRVASDADTLKELIERSSFSLLVRAAGKNAALYSPAYIAALERYSPVRFSVARTISPGMLDTRLRDPIHE
jgi:hypothetical protein